MLLPGAKRSRHVPKFENDARASVLVVAPMVFAAATRAGEVVARVRVRVARGDRVRDAGVDRVVDGAVEGRADAAAEAHVRDRRPDVVRGHPVDARDHARVRARALAVEHPDGVERDLLRDAVRRSAGRAGDVRPVAVAVVRPVPVADEIGAVAHAAGELLVRGPHAGVDDVGVHAGTGLVVGVGVVQRQVALVDPVEPPRGRGLRRECVHDLVRLDVGDAGIPRDRGRSGGRHAHREALERMAVDEADPARVGRRELSRGRGDGRALHGVRLEDDDVRARGRAPGGAAFGCDCEPGKREAREQRGERSHCSLLGLTTRQVKARRGGNV